MEIRKVNFKGREYQIVNESWSNSYAWGHKSTLLRNGVELASTKVRYYNRTWEYYQYQSSMYRVLGQYFDEVLSAYIDNYKREKEIERFKRGEKAKVIEEFKTTPLFLEIQEIRERIKNRNFD